MKYHYAQDGEWVRPVRRGYRRVCCDCGLVHRYNYRVRKRVLEVQAFRDSRATGQIRSRMKRKLQGLWEKKSKK